MLGDLHRRRTASDCPTRRRSTSSSATRTRTACSRPTTSPPTPAPESSTSHPLSVKRTRTSPRRRHRGRAAARRRAASSPRGAAVRGPEVFDANPRIIKDLKARPGRCCGHETNDHSYPHCWRCGNPLIYMAVARGSCGHEVPRPHGRAEPGDHLGARAHQGRPVRQVARGCARLEHQPQPLLGQPDPGVGVRRPGLPAHGRVRLARRAGARLRRAPDRSAPPLRRRADAAQPGRPDRQVDHAPGARGARLLVRVRLDAVRAGALPVREPRTGSRTTIRATSSSSTTGRPAAGSTRCTCWPPRCSTGRRSEPASRTASCSATTA